MFSGPAEASKDISSPVLSSPLRNYGGVYVGLPADLTTVAASQSKSTHKGKHLQHCIRNILHEC
uniref:Overexpressed in colon carcinoma 1 protein n=1 Tax=Amphiprion percula TaxID=161767 RepID=A0A3P8SG66_AMPPE